MSTESQRQRPTDDDQQLEHVPIVAGAGPRINSDELWRGSHPKPGVNRPNRAGLRAVRVQAGQVNGYLGCSLKSIILQGKTSMLRTTST